jgi:hypothetical protein
MQIEWRAGTSDVMKVPDALTRLPQARAAVLQHVAQRELCDLPELVPFPTKVGELAYAKPVEPFAAMMRVAKKAHEVPESNGVIIAVMESEPEGPGTYDYLPRFLAAYEKDEYLHKPAGQAGLSQRDGLYYHGEQLYVPKDKELREIIMYNCHATPYVMHRKIDGTLELVRRLYFWPGMTADVEDYVRSCVQCQQAATTNQRYAGKLMPLGIPGGRWHSISLDFITDLPKSKGKDAILVIVCR